jgi:hypothetical protein
MIKDDVKTYKDLKFEIQKLETKASDILDNIKKPVEEAIKNTHKYSRDWVPHIEVEFYPYYTGTAKYYSDDNVVFVFSDSEGDFDRCSIPIAKLEGVLTAEDLLTFEDHEKLDEKRKMEAEKAARAARKEKDERELYLRLKEKYGGE